jgi:hypothetical protein
MLKAYEEKRMAERKTDQEKREAERKARQEDLEKMMNAKVNSEMDAIRAKTKARQEEMLARMQENTQAIREDIKSAQAEIRSIICAFQSEIKETIQREMRAAIQSVQSELDETTTCREATEIEPDPGIMQSIEAHQEIPKGEVAVMPVGGLRERRRVRNLDTERRQKRKERTRGNSEIRRKSDAACRELFRRAKNGMAKRNIITKIRTLEKCGPRNEFVAAGIRTTRCAKVAWHKERSHEGPSVEQGRRKDQIRIKFASGTRKG